MASTVGRSLDNYKEQFKSLAESKGVLKDFLAASTLTRAKALLHGEKKKNYLANRQKGNNKK